jgi:hypothetical protein
VRRMFIAHQHDDLGQARGFILLRWNINVGFTFFGRSLVDPVQSNDQSYIRRSVQGRVHP